MYQPKSIYKATTPTFKLTFPDSVDFSTASSIYVTFSDDKEKKLLEKTGASLSIDENVIEVFLTQQETLAFPTGSVLVQVNWTYQEGTVTKRPASTKARIDFKKNLKNEVI